MASRSRRPAPTPWSAPTRWKPASGNAPPGRWRRQIVEQEFCHFLQGRCTFTPDGGETIRIEAGDALLLPENSLGVWDVQETVRKSYVIIHR